MSRGRLLILSPSFHDYDRAFAAAFEALGFDVVTHLYDRSSSVGAKLRTKLVHELPERLGRDTTAQRSATIAQSAIAAVRDSRPDAILVIKGDVLGPEVWEEVRSTGAPYALWLYDELRRTRWAPDALAQLPRVASYSRDDVDALRADGIDAVHVPLGFDHLLDLGSARHPAREVTFIGARYANREAFVTGLAGAGVPVRAYGRDWSRDPRDIARTWGASRPNVPWGRDLSRDAAYRAMRDCAATLNIHGDQDGFTMRTFEASGVGGAQIVDRSDVDTLYEPGTEVLVAQDADEAIDHARHLLAEPSWAERLRTAARKRTLAEHTLVHRAHALMNSLGA